MFGINVDPSQAKGNPCAPVNPCVPKKPELRGFLVRTLKQRLIGAFVVGVVSAGAVRLGLVRRRRMAYMEFYEKYDAAYANADFERMKRVGVFQCVRPDGSVGGL